MKKMIFVILCSFLLLKSHSQTAQPIPPFVAELNSFGEVKTSIMHASSIQPWTDKILARNKEMLVQKFGEGLYYDVLNHSSMNQWPSAFSNIRTFDPNDPVFQKFNVYFIAFFDQYVIVRVPYKENTHVPASYLPSDKTDLYFILFDMSIRNTRGCINAAKNDISKYPASLFARNTKTGGDTDAPTPGLAEFDAGLAAEKKREFKEAMEWYKKAADKGNVVALYNIGVLYYNNNTGEGYSTQQTIEDAIYPGESAKRRYAEALKWFRKGAEKGSYNCMYTIGVMYKEGNSVDKDPAEAKRWFQKAADNGSEKAKEMLKKMQ